MGLKEWSPDEARKVLESLEVKDVNESTLRTCLTDGRNPKYSNPAPLTEDQAAQLEALRRGR